MRKAALALLPGLLLLTACLSTQQRRYFVLQMPRPETGALPRIERTLLVEDPQISRIYDETRIVYRISPYEINYYSYVFWAENPARVIGRTMADWLSRGEAFARVVRDVVAVEPDLLLRSNVLALEEVDQPEAWYGRLAMEFELYNFRSGEVILRHAFDRREPLPRKQVTALPVTVSRILEEELSRAVRAAAAKLER